MGFESVAVLLPIPLPPHPAGRLRDPKAGKGKYSEK
jgi:hypothetical protein